ncbi:COP9 signalosome complex subunit 2-like protein [Anaeromyces robustus]|uniref:COP9 signalosome complex subunit 2-like protein n=1 Tax=Anaeromyces robustus TaxID=1754192 RepID=A0A1Y1V5V8_9FUNG|nr:COP9 signalosome complex subunit 2-like protein [Anaeromyces robustus]|eukprot:ORX48068.1 COP9 signalosome complex subunit 2-like protein [Anaeromyces robustus]
MSDFEDDDDFMVEDDEEYDFDFEYDEDNEEEEQNVDLENKYYNAKALKEDNPEEAIKEFQNVIDSDTEQSDWSFKACKQMVKVSLKIKDYEGAIKYYKKLLSLLNIVAKSYSEKSINNILDYASNSDSIEFLEQFYEITLNKLEETKNDRLWLKTNLKLAKLLLDNREYSKLTKVIDQLHKACEQENNPDGQGTLLVEVFAIEIQMYTEMKNTKKLKPLYQQCLNVKSAIPHPRIMGIIRECGGKMHMIEGKWNDAQTDFFEAFKNFDEAGSPQRIQCLKYKNDNQIVALTNLINAYQRVDIDEFESILKKNQSTIMNDPFIRTYMDDVIKNIRSQVLIRLIKPYTRIKLSFASKIKKINGYIDQINQILELEHDKQSINYYPDIGKWSNNVEKLIKTFDRKMD